MKKICVLNLLVCVLLLSACGTQELKSHYDEKYRSEISKNYHEVVAMEGAIVKTDNHLTTVSFDDKKTLYFFTEKGHPIYPTQIVSKEIKKDMYWSWISVASKETFDTWLTEFLEKRIPYKKYTDCDRSYRKAKRGSFDLVNYSHDYGHRFFAKGYLSAELELKLNCVAKSKN